MHHGDVYCMILTGGNSKTYHIIYRRERKKKKGETIISSPLGCNSQLEGNHLSLSLSSLFLFFPPLFLGVSATEYNITQQPPQKEIGLAAAAGASPSSPPIPP